MDAPAYVEALRSKDTAFSVGEPPTGGFDFTFSRAIYADGKPLGVVIVGAEMAQLERDWVGVSEGYTQT